MSLYVSDGVRWASLVLYVFVLLFSVGRQRFVRDVLNASPLLSESHDGPKGERLHFYKPDPRRDAAARRNISTGSRGGRGACREMRKRQRRSEGCDRSSESPPSKRAAAAFTAEDLDLLNSYWGMFPRSIPHSSRDTTGGTQQLSSWRTAFPLISLFVFFF